MTKEEKKEYMREYHKLYYKKNKEKILEQKQQYYKDNKEQVLEQQKQYRKDNTEQMKQYRKDNAERIREYRKQYNKTPIGRALYLIGSYNQSDKKYNRGKGDLTAKWIVENIFSKPCAHCGKTGWDIIGCNRLDNSKPHTMDNVEPCCFECNRNIG